MTTMIFTTKGDCEVVTKVHGSGHLTDSDRAQIHDLAEQGLKPGQIAQRLRRHPSTVQWFMYTNGLTAPKPLPEGRRTSYLRGPLTVYRYTDEEDVFIEALRIQNFDCTEIARLSSKRFNIRRGHHSIRCRLKMLASREVVSP